MVLWSKGTLGEDGNSKQAAYVGLGVEELRKRAEQAWQEVRDCQLCGRRCGVDRTQDEMGVCQVGRSPIVASYGPHFGEEPPITGRRGSGTIFFAGCNLRCNFCQNYTIAHYGRGQPVDEETLANMMLSLQRSGCHNINLVSPTHVLPQILSVLVMALEKGLNVPLVYNTGGYDLPRTLEILRGVIDIYMPDMKFGDSSAAELCAGAPDYPQVNFSAVKEMHSQVGDLVMDKRGIARRGLLVRHLVLPEDLAGSETVLGFIAKELSPDTTVNIMAQYYPCHQAVGHPRLGRRIYRDELNAALLMAERHGLKNLL